MATGQAEWIRMTQLADQISGGSGSEGTADQIARQLSGLQTTLETLAPQWQSQAASAFYSVNSTWQENAAALNKALMDIATGLRESAGAYQRMTEESAETVTNIPR
jgi:WXG100 family type VII secretion target